MRPVIVYVIGAFILHIFIDIGFVMGKKAPGFLFPNAYLYNISSIFRFICFSLFFISLRQPFLVPIKKILPIIGLVLVFLIFRFLKDDFNGVYLSSRLFALEAGMLLFYSLQYYLYKMQDDVVRQRTPDYWVVIGLSIYVVFNFIYFLFYQSLLDKGYITTVADLWNLHNVTFIILCIFIGKAFYASNKR